MDALGRVAKRITDCQPKHHPLDPSEVKAGWQLMRNLGKCSSEAYANATGGAYLPENLSIFSHRTPVYSRSANRTLARLAPAAETGRISGVAIGTGYVRGFSELRR